MNQIPPKQRPYREPAQSLRYQPSLQSPASSYAQLQREPQGPSSPPQLPRKEAGIQQVAEPTRFAAPGGQGIPSLEVESNIYGGKSTYDLTKLVTNIGRDPSNDIVIDAPVVSHFHAQIVREGNQFLLVHPHPLQPHTINGLLYQGCHILGNEPFRKPLVCGDIFRIGNEHGALVTLTYHDGGKAPQAIVPEIRPLPVGAPVNTPSSQSPRPRAQPQRKQQEQASHLRSRPNGVVQQPPSGTSEPARASLSPLDIVNPLPVAAQSSTTLLLGKLVSMLQPKASETTKSTPPSLSRWKANLLLYGLTTIVVALLVGSVLNGFGMLPSAITSTISTFGGTLAAILGVLGGLFAGSILQMGMKDIWQQANRPLTTLASILTVGVLFITLFYNADPYLHRGMLALNDPLQDNSQGYNWNDCSFVDGALHVSSEQQHHGIHCTAQSIDFSNFVYEVQMTILHGDGGGLVFRQNLTALASREYIFKIYSNGSYHLELYNSISQYGDFKPSTTVYKSGPDPSIHAGQNKPNTLAVIATSSSIELWANGKRLVNLPESTYKEGGFIGVDVEDITQPTEVTFSNAKVWTLP